MNRTNIKSNLKKSEKLRKEEQKNRPVYKKTYTEPTVKSPVIVKDTSRYQVVYRIARDADMLSNKVFDFTSNLFMMPPNITLSNICPIAMQQLYKFGFRDASVLDTMISTPKVIAYSFSSEFEKQGSINRSCKLILVAPESIVAKDSNGNKIVLPSVYSLSVVYDKNDCNRSRILLQAFVGGREDGAFNLYELENTHLEDGLRLVHCWDDICVKEGELHEHIINPKNMGNVNIQATIPTKMENKDLTQALQFVLDKINCQHMYKYSHLDEKIEDCCKNLLSANKFRRYADSIVPVSAKEIIENITSNEQVIVPEKTLFRPKFSYLYNDRGAANYTVRVKRDDGGRAD